jgi:FkbM family methyltransferase
MPAYKQKKFIDDIDGINEWYWPEHDVELFAGPAADWIHCHKEFYFKFLKKTDVCIQAGGACGMYPKLFAQKFKTVYTFEPEAENFYFLASNCYESNIIKFNAALGSRSGFVSLNKLEKTNQGQFEVSITGNDIIPIMTIDGFNFPDVDLIQLDIEGYELEAVIGGINTIKKFKPVLALEISFITPSEKLFRLLYELGYILIAKSSADLIFVHKDNMVGNV